MRGMRDRSAKVRPEMPRWWHKQPDATTSKSYGDFFAGLASSRRVLLYSERGKQQHGQQCAADHPTQRDVQSRAAECEEPD